MFRQSDSADKPHKIQIRFHWSAQQTTQDTDQMSWCTSLVSSAPIDQTSSAHPTSAGKYALSALRLTRPALHSSTIAGNYALSAPVKTLQCKYERGNVLLKVSKCYTQLHAQESRRTQPRMDTIWKDVQYERWRDITQTSCHSQHIQFFTSSLLSQAGTLIDRYESLWRAKCSWVQSGTEFSPQSYN